MKKIIVTLILFVGLAVAATAQVSWNYTKLDSLVNADTVIYTVAPIGLKSADWYYSSSIVADSISGTTSGKIYFEVSNRTTGDYWHRVDSTTIDGVQTKDYNTGTIQAQRVRYYMVSDSTQVTYVRLAIHGVKR